MKAHPFVVVIALCACGGDTDNPGVEWSLVDGQPQTYALQFPDIATLSDAANSGFEFRSSGPDQGATLVTVEVRSEQSFHVTGARADRVSYNLAPIGGNPAGSGQTRHEGAVAASLGQPIGASELTVKADGSAVIEIGLQANLSDWGYADSDRNGTAFRVDQDELIQGKLDLCLQGYLDDGTEVDGAYPAPLQLSFSIAHD